MRPRKKRIDKGAPKWMVTYADMVTLILVFFVLLFSMSQIDLVKFEAIAESFRNRMVFDGYPSIVEKDHPTENIEIQEDKEGAEDLKNDGSEKQDIEDLKEAPNEVESEVVTEETNQQTNSDKQENEEDSLDELLKEVEDFLEKNELNNVITANRTEQGVVLILQEKVLFDSGKADILKSGEPFLDKVGMLLGNIPNQVRVEGHTDNRPISNYRFPSNWELSGARASGVIRYLIDSTDIADNRFIAVGYGDTKPLVENNSPANWSKNRRVEMVILEIDEEN
ncbi:flagellar motor protein MotB [Aquibacillus koreensis]|uniref:Flagellar motor protein MotB n=1 Tax=Aquibacillus koreensis TaxID=279446 RepID=A0A9X3WKZ7_9BACI|nr:flagellar motor protein MotB [Aquibacillus koreensis]MCT2535007.1 flagellar motor protein MotB [Aquibacillus koreensis]MDC3419294.1 flagellar motor protein MotB [Aquibacillus koreensis]